MRYLRTNTDCRITVGPFMDKTDGVTPETALTVTNCKLTLMVDVANVPTLVLDAAATASSGNNDMVHVTNDDAGFYDLELTATQTNYLGRAMLAITDAANHCPVFHEFMLLPAQVYDSLILGTDLLDANVAKVNESLQTAGDLAALVATVDTVVDAIKAKTDNLPASPAATGDIPTADITAIKAKTDNLPTDPADQSAVEAAITAATSPLATAANLATVAGYIDTEITTIDTVVDAIKAKTDNLPASPAATSDIPTAAAIADQVWDEAIAGHTGAGSTGLALSTASSGGVDPAILADAIWDEALAGHATAGTAGKKLTDLANADLSGVTTAVDAIKAKTDNLPTDPADQSAVEAAITAAGTFVLPALQGHVYTAVAVQQRTLTIVQGDTPRIVFDLGADYTGYAIRFGAKAAAGDVAYVISPVTGAWTTAASGIGYVDLDATDTATAGTLKAEIELTSGATVLTAIKFDLVILAQVVVPAVP